MVTNRAQVTFFLSPQIWTNPKLLRYKGKRKPTTIKEVASGNSFVSCCINTIPMNNQ